MLVPRKLMALYTMWVLPSLSLLWDSWCEGSLQLHLFFQKYDISVMSYRLLAKVVDVRLSVLYVCLSKCMMGKCCDLLAYVIIQKHSTTHSSMPNNFHDSISSRFGLSHTSTIYNVRTDRVGKGKLAIILLSSLDGKIRKHWKREKAL